MNFEIIGITPQMAANYLKCNIKNRKLNNKIIDKYANDMKNNLWEFTGDGIKFSSEGQLLDGQHRLMAIIKSNTTNFMPVFTNLSPNAQTVIDCGKARSFANVLQMSGKKSSTIYSATLRLLYVYEIDKMWEAGNITISNQELKKFMAKMDESILNYAIFLGETLSHKGKIIKSTAIATTYIILLKKNNKNEVENYLKKIMLGFDIPENSVEHKIRLKLISLSNSNKKTKSATRSNYLVAILISGFNAIKQNKILKSIKIHTNSPFPKPL